MQTKADKVQNHIKTKNIQINIDEISQIADRLNEIFSEKLAIIHRQSPQVPDVIRLHFQKKNEEKISKNFR